MQEYDLYINPKKPSIGLYVRKGAGLLIWPMPANGYTTAPQTTSTYRLTLCGTSKLPVTPSGSWIE